jgi:hypothetical protein
MNWSAYILNLYDQGYSVEQIVEKAEHSVITLVYVNNVIKTENAKYKRQYGIEHKRSNPKTPHYIKIAAYIKEVGEQEFLKKYRELKSIRLAVIIGVSNEDITHYVKSYVRPVSTRPKHMRGYRTYLERLLAEGKIKKQEKPKTIQDISTLW